MKKTLISTVLAFCIICSFGLSAFASNSPSAVKQADGSTIIYNNDGTYTVVSPVTPVEVSGVNARAINVVGSAITASNHENDDDSVNWVYTLYCSFIVNEGISSECNSAVYDYTIYNDEWSFSNGSNSIEGNSGYGYGTFKQKVLFFTVNTIDVALVIRCDVYGNFYA